VPASHPDASALRSNPIPASRARMASPGAGSPRIDQATFGPTRRGGHTRVVYERSQRWRQRIPSVRTSPSWASARAASCAGRCPRCSRAPVERTAGPPLATRLSKEADANADRNEPDLASRRQRVDTPVSDATNVVKSCERGAWPKLIVHRPPHPGRPRLDPQAPQLPQGQRQVHDTPDPRLHAVIEEGDFDGFDDGCKARPSCRRRTEEAYVVSAAKGKR
jgi:hypothetical protein